MRRRIQICIAVLSIALQATDLLLGGWGHSHDQPGAEAGACHGQCDHHHDGGLPNQSHDESPNPSDSHDDCSLCRHFSQPVVPASLDIPVVECERVAPLFSQFLPAAGHSAEIVHPARGPPSDCA